MKRKIIISLIAQLALSVSLIAQVSFTASAPSAVVMGQTFRVTYSVNAAAKDFRGPEFADFEELAGPFTSQNNSMQIINGQMSSSVSYSYSYTLQPKKEGTFVISAATVMVENQKYTSNSLTVKVLPPDKPQSNSQQQNQQQQQVTAENIFILAQLSRTTVFEQDYTLLTYKLYSLVDLVDFGNIKLPDAKGFLKQEIELPRQRQLNVENYKGRNYNTLVLHQSLLYPQRTGTIDIEKGSIEVIVRLRNTTRTNRGFFDDFFDTYQDVKRTLTIPSARIEVEPLPSNKPASFSGVVGDLSLLSSINSTSVMQNDAITLKIKISGSGNLKMISTPTIDFPADIEVHGPKVDNNFQSTSYGVTGSKLFEYTLIPRSSGEFTIPSVAFSYFNTKTKSYKTLQSNEYTIKVTKDASGSAQVIANYTGKENVKMLGKDIRYIQTKGIRIHKKNDFALNNVWFFIGFYVIPFLLTLTLIIIYRKRLKENANILLVKNRKANKLSKKRLKMADKYLQEGMQEAFYDETLKALWLYVSDKLNLPLSELNKDNAEIELRNSNVEETVIQEFMKLLSTCEFARYAPSASSITMNEVYEQATEMIGKLQESIKINRKL